MWQVKEQYIHSGLGHHVVHLHNPDTKAEHILQIIIGHESCALCGHVKVVENAENLNPRALVAGEIENLEAAHRQVHAYGRKHGIKVVSE